MVIIHSPTSFVMFPLTLEKNPIVRFRGRYYTFSFCDQYLQKYYRKPVKDKLEFIRNFNSRQGNRESPKGIPVVFPNGHFKVQVYDMSYSKPMNLNRLLSVTVLGVSSEWLYQVTNIYKNTYSLINNSDSIRNFSDANASRRIPGKSQWCLRPVGQNSKLWCITLQTQESSTMVIHH